MVAHVICTSQRQPRSTILSDEAARMEHELRARAGEADGGSQEGGGRGQGGPGQR